MNTLVALLPLGLGCAVLAALLWGRRRKVRALKNALQGDREFQISGTGIFENLQLSTLPPLRPAKMVGYSGSRYSPPTWVAQADCGTVGSRTTLFVRREGVLKKLRDVLGMKDVRTGDDDFDKLANLCGGEPDIVRAIFSDPHVQRAARSLLACTDFVSFSVEASGAATAVFLQRNTHAEEMKQLLRLAIELCDACDGCARLPPLPDPNSSVRVSGTGSTSGTPVAVPLGDRRSSGPS